MKIEMWPVDKPVPYPKNARKISDQGKWPRLRRLVSANLSFVDKQGVIVVGHARLLGPKKLGHKLVRWARQPHQQGHLAPLIELDPKSCDVIGRIWQDITGTIAYLEDGRTLAQLESKIKKAELA
jgi:hypothetical protein